MTTKTCPELDEFVALSQAKLGLVYDDSDLKVLRKKSPQHLACEVARLRRMRDYSAATAVAETAILEPVVPQSSGTGYSSHRSARPAVSPAKVNFAATLLRRLWASDLETGEELVAELAGKNADQLDRLIDNLKTLVADMEASDPQIALLRRLWARKMVRNAELDEALEAKLAVITNAEASKLIDMLNKTPDVPREQQSQQTQPASKNGPAVQADGMYRNPETGEIFKVQIACTRGGSGRLYAKRMAKLDEPKIVRGKEAHYEFVYAAGAIMKIQPEWQLTRADAKAFGDMYGCCMRCGLTLTDDQSIADGLGRWCNGRM